MKSFGYQVSSVVWKEGREEEIKEDDEANERAELLPAAPPAESITQFPDDIAKMLGSIKERVEAGHGAGQREKLTIYQVPRLLRQGKEKWYEPQLISIGPYHRDKKHLQPMEEQKILHLRKILSRNEEVKLEDYMEALMKLEQQTKNCYPLQWVSQIRRDEFVKMMLLDGCFLVEIFLQNMEDGEPSDYDEMWLLDFISNDMLLLENQLPYFVLNSIYELVEPDLKNVVPMAKLVLRCFGDIKILQLNEREPLEEESYHHLVHLLHHRCLPINDSRDDRGRGTNDSHDGRGRGTNDSRDGRQGANSPMDSSVCVKLASFINCCETSLSAHKPEEHLKQELLLHVAPTPAPQGINSKTNDTSATQRGYFKGMIRSFASCRPLRSVIPSSCFRSSPEGEEALSVPSAEELDEAGIKFELPKKSGDSFLSIKFRKEDGVLEIPYLFFSDVLESIVLNFVAFEQCTSTNADAFFVRYVCLMDCLISSGKDVKILRRSKVLEHELGSDEELADVFNRMRRGVVWDCGDNSPLGQLYKGINDYCRADCHRWRAYWKHNYCYNPCTTISLLAAVVLLLLTVTQTYFAVFPRA